jgi:hypothetical protein
VLRGLAAAPALQQAALHGQGQARGAIWGCRQPFQFGQDPLAGHRLELLVVLADSLVRVAPTVSELRLGIAMSLLGGPFFLVLLQRLKRTLP